MVEFARSGAIGALIGRGRGVIGAPRMLAKNNIGPVKRRRAQHYPRQERQPRS
jgi:hypothetical protein